MESSDPDDSYSTNDESPTQVTRFCPADHVTGWSLVGSVMGRGDLTNREWSLLEPHLPPLGGQDGRWNDHRTVINGILFRIRTGVPWRDLPERYGSWKTVYERHRRWSADGTWDRIPHAVQAGVDSTSCRAHQQAAGARKAKPRVPKKGRRPGTTGPTRDSDDPGAA
ncbi:transposase [Streptomyces griseoaurantiacus]|nr:transposase [Streptomyces griseoaurantiacus]